MPKSIKNHGKSTKMVTRNAPKAILEASRFQERSQGGPVSIFLSIIGATWAILADFWDPSKSEGAPKTVQKIQYGDFWAPRGGQKVKKRGFGWCLKKHEIFIKNRCENGRFLMAPNEVF